jgi:hypothetical protein
MNKKLNTALFIVVGTLVNLLFAFILIAILLFIVWNLKPLIGEQSMTTVLPIAFFIGLILSMFAYQKLSKWVIIKYQLEDKLDPLFKTRKKKY